MASVKEGRLTFQRILTYTLNSVTHKISNIFFLLVGLVITGHAILTPMLMVISMLAGDLLTMSETTDNVRPSSLPNVWQINRLTAAGVLIGVSNLLFCTSVFAFAKFHLLFGLGSLRTLAMILLVFSGEATLYSLRKRRRIWSSWPSRWMILSTIADIIIILILATRGIGMTVLPVTVVASTLGAAVAFAFVLDTIKVPVFRRLKIS